MSSSKIKILKIIDILRGTDEDHPKTATDIAKDLAACGIEAERKSICRDINVLMDMDDKPYEIVLCDDARNGYFMSSREFEDWEIKVLVDAVGQARFLTENQSKSLCDRLISMVSDDSQKMLRRVTFMQPKYRSEVSSTKIYIDRLLKAIRTGRKVSFSYTRLDVNMQRKERTAGKKYVISPYALIWQDDRYYLICNTDPHPNLSCYRLDRIVDLEILEDKMIPAEDIVGPNADLELKKYASQMVNMYGGDTVRLTLRIKESIAEYMVEHFGEDATFSNTGDGYYTMQTFVKNGDGLYYFLMQYSDSLQVLAPKTVRDKLKDILKKAWMQYEDADEGDADHAQDVE